MHVNCLPIQEGMFETRLLRRVFEPAFIDVDDIARRLASPLVLYGNWHPEGFIGGLRWLAGFVFQLPHPCILLPPFENGHLENVLGLDSKLNVMAVNTTSLSVLPEADSIILPMNQVLQIQTDYAFSGPAGKPWITTGESQLASLLLIQPKNTSTPLLFCGSRLLSASGLSNDDDRLALLEGIVSWAWRWEPIPDHSKKETTTPKKLDDQTWNVVCVVLAGSRLTSPKEVIALAGSLFGVEISQTDLQLAIQRLIKYDLASIDNENLELKMDALEAYSQQNGLWAYVRSLRKDFERTQP